MFKLSPRPTQTQEKHRILDVYLRAWGSIILNGIAGNMKRHGAAPGDLDVHFVYVDCHSYAGRYASGPGDPPDDYAERVVYGSPIIGLKALDSLATTATAHGIQLRTNAIFIEMDRANVRELENTLGMSGVGWKIRKTSDFASLAPRELALVHGDSTMMAPALNRYTASPYTRSLYFLDPYGPKGIPLQFVRQIVSQPRHDTIINMPYQDLHKKSGYLKRTERAPGVDATLENYNAMFGHTNWQGIVERLQANPSWRNGTLAEAGATIADSPYAAEAASLEVELVEMYRASLLDADPDLAVKSLPLLFPDRERTMFHLCLTTHDGTGALAMNGLLRKAKVHEKEIRFKLRLARRERKMGMADMFAGDPDVASPPKPKDIAFETKEIADDIAMRFHRRTLTRGQLYKEMADSPYTASEVDAALKSLKKAGRLAYAVELRNTTPLRFGMK